MVQDPLLGSLELHSDVETAMRRKIQLAQMSSGLHSAAQTTMWKEFLLAWKSLGLYLAVS